MESQKAKRQGVALTRNARKGVFTLLIGKDAFVERLDFDQDTWNGMACGAADCSLKEGCFLGVNIPGRNTIEYSQQQYFCILHSFLIGELGSVLLKPCGASRMASLLHLFLFRLIINKCSW